MYPANKVKVTTVLLRSLYLENELIQDDWDSHRKFYK